MEKTTLTPLEHAQKFLEKFEPGAPTAGESAITWALVALAENLGRVATALDKLADKVEEKGGK